MTEEEIKAIIEVVRKAFSEIAADLREEAGVELHGAQFKREETAEGEPRVNVRLTYTAKENQV